MITTVIWSPIETQESHDRIILSNHQNLCDWENLGTEKRLWLSMDHNASEVSLGQNIDPHAFTMTIQTPGKLSNLRIVIHPSSQKSATRNEWSDDGPLNSHKWEDSATKWSPSILERGGGGLLMKNFTKNSTCFYSTPKYDSDRHQNLSSRP